MKDIQLKITKNFNLIKYLNCYKKQLSNDDQPNKKKKVKNIDK